jgi:response regulator RpfG family c-di-GMP phosphodiesterase
MVAAAAHPILAADDEPSNLDLLARILRRRSRTVLLASDGEEALDILGRQRVDLIIADQRMPKLAGTELLRRARDLQPDAMRVLVTGYADVDTLTAAINESQAFQVLCKPVDVRVLDLVVQRALEAHESHQREKELFEAFILASVSAIEQRDPSTAGHSVRVAAMTTGLAMVVDGVGDGPLADVRFTREELDQLKYASLLHDFGKIGVRESILVKSHKLPPARRALLSERIRLSIEHGRVDAERGEVLARLLAQLDDPGVSSRQNEAGLAELAASGLIEPDDMAYLRIDRGSLSDAERAAIRAHVQGTISFLRQIPWPPRLGRLVEIAGAHHEKLDGTGYPKGTTNIPVEARMMTICDIYDALVAADRPYKTAISHEAALDILHGMERCGEIDGALLACFVERRVFRVLRQVQRGG